MKCLMCVMIVFFVLGCANSQRSDLAMVREILALAKEDKVAGQMRVHLSGKVEAGLKEGVYFGSPGSTIDADLAFTVGGIEADKSEDIK